MFHEKTKHIKVDYHFIKEIMMSKKVITLYIRFEDLLADVFTKAFEEKYFSVMCSKPSLSNILPQLNGECKKLLVVIWQRVVILSHWTLYNWKATWCKHWTREQTFLCYSQNQFSAKPKICKNSRSHQILQTSKTIHTMQKKNFKLRALLAN